MTGQGRMARSLGQKKLRVGHDHSKGGKRAKVDIRRNVIEAMQAPIKVFDVFAGAGDMHRAVWNEFDYTGCDKRYFRDGRRVYVADNRRVLRAIDLNPYNVFDLDAFGSPWEQALIIAARRQLKPGERVGLIVTEAGLPYKNAVVPRAVTQLTGLRNQSLPGAMLYQGRHEVQARIWQALGRRMNGELIKLWRADGSGNQAMHYMGAIFAAAA